MLGINVTIHSYLMVFEITLFQICNCCNYHTVSTHYFLNRIDNMDQYEVIEMIGIGSFGKVSNPTSTIINNTLVTFVPRYYVDVCYYMIVSDDGCRDDTNWHIIFSCIIHSHNQYYYNYEGV